MTSTKLVSALMGIQGLLPVLKPITNTVHVSKYRGQKVAVDAYCWLHKAAYCCAEEICEGKFTDKYTCLRPASPFSNVMPASNRLVDAQACAVLHAKGADAATMWRSACHCV